MKPRLLATLLSTSLSAVLLQIPHLAWSQTPVHNPTLTVIGYHEIINTKSALIPEYAVSTTQFQQHIDG
jgi:biofilm PGA synthesis lipoprotein PgaB